MLLNGLIAVAVIAAVLICVGVGAFASLQWLWVLPVGFVGSFLVVLLLAVVVMVIMAKLVDTSTPREEFSNLYLRVLNQYVDMAAKLLGVRFHATGLEKRPESGRFLLVCNHISDIDPVVIYRYLPKSELAFISKKENDKKPVIYEFQHMLMGQPINRENDREGLKTILNCIRLLKEDKASIAVFPEGYTSLDRLLHPFRNGVFKIALKAKVPIVVCTVRNTHKALANVLKFKRLDVYFDILDVLQPEQVQGMTAVQIGEMVHKMMEDHLGPDLVRQETT